LTFFCEDIQRASRSFKRRRKKSMKKGDQNESFRGRIYLVPSDALMVAV
jgi:hypothetical protein